MSPREPIIALTGSAGLIGRSVEQKLQMGGIRTTHLSLRKDRLNELPAKLDSFKQSGGTKVLNLAWIASSTVGYRESQENFDCLSASLLLARHCYERRIKFYGVGSIAEEFPNVSRYSLSKKMLRYELQGYIHSGAAAWLRPFYVFAPGTWPTYLRSGEVTLVRDNRLRDFIHVEDVANAIALSLEANLTGDIDIGSGIMRTPSQLLAASRLEYRLVSPDEEQILHRRPDLGVLQSVGWKSVETDQFFGKEA